MTKKTVKDRTNNCNTCNTNYLRPNGVKLLDQFASLVIETGIRELELERLEREGDRFDHIEY